MTGRRLNVTAEVARRLPDAHLAQMQAQIDDPDNRCGLCGELIAGPVAEAVILREENFSMARLAHPECARSGIYQWPGLRAAMDAYNRDGVDITTSIGRRPAPAPRALVFVQLDMNFSTMPPGGSVEDATDLLDDHAAVLGLTPVSGRIEQITPPKTTTSRLEIDATVDTLVLVHPRGRDVILDEDPDALAGWCETAREDHASALIITARGLGLTQQPTTILEAIATRPAYAAQVTVTGLPQPRRRWPNPLRR